MVTKQRDDGKVGVETGLLDPLGKPCPRLIGLGEARVGRGGNGCNEIGTGPEACLVKVTV